MIKDLSFKKRPDHNSSVESASIVSEELDTFKKKVKDLKQRNKTDLEIKENQVKALKGKIESLCEQLESMRESQSDSGKDMPLQMVANKDEKQMKKDRQKIKKYEAIIKQCLVGI